MIYTLLIGIHEIHLSYERTLGLFRVFFGDENSTQLCGDDFINHEIRILSLNNQYLVESKEPFFNRGSDVIQMSLNESLGG